MSEKIFWMCVLGVSLVLLAYYGYQLAYVSRLVN